MAAGIETTFWTVEVLVNKQEYIDRLKLTIERLHNCSAVHADTFYVEESFRGKTIWSGNVEAFKLTAQGNQRRCEILAKQAPAGTRFNRPVKQRVLWPGRQCISPAFAGSCH
jgi:hypothetical protein